MPPSKPALVERERSQGDGAARPSEPIPPPKPAEKFETTVREFSVATTERGGCAALRRLSYTGLPQLTQRRCTDLHRRLEGFHPAGTAVYGTGALVDFETRRKPGSVLFVLGPEKEFRWVELRPRTEAADIAGSEAPAGVDVDGAAREAVEAIRAGDCVRLAGLAAAQLRDAKSEGIERQCSESPLRDVLQEDLEVAPEPLGANSGVAFYSLSPGAGRRYFTLVMVFEAGQARFLRAFPVAPRRAKR